MKIVFFILLYYLGFVCTFQPSDYSYSQTINEYYTIYWSIERESLLLALKVQTTGWIGFGLGEPTSGSMKGADFLVVEWVPEYIPNITDRYSEEFAEPLTDSCAHWTLKSYSLEAPISIIEVERKLITGDSQDRPILNGTNKILWAYGDSQDSRINYHSKRRGVYEITFIPPSEPTPPPPEVYLNASITMKAITIPPQKTNYICYTVPVPIPDITKTYHIVKIEGYVQPGNTDLVHHLLVHSCNYGPPATDYLNASQCHSLLGHKNCPELLYAWAVGGTNLDLPPEAGYRMGVDQTNGYSIQYITLEIHYDNPSLTEGRLDSSGIVIYFTEKLRPNDAGTLILGNINVDETPIPPRSSYFRIESDCPSVCTSNWEHPITVFGDFLHMHQVGSMIWSTQHRDNQRLPGYMNRIEYWDFAFQNYIPINRVIEPGDHLNLICIYDTTAKSDYTYFGTSSDQEMCLEILAYYPRLKMAKSLCGSFHARLKRMPDGSFDPYMNANTRNYSTFCFNFDIPVDEYNISLVNPLIPDLAYDGNRTFGFTSECNTQPEPVPLFFWILIGLLGSLVLCSILFGIRQISKTLKSRSNSAYAPVPMDEVTDFFQDGGQVPRRGESDSHNFFSE